MAGGEGERVAALEAKLREQGDAMAAMQRDMALLKGMAEGAGKGSASGKAAEGIGAQQLKGARGRILTPLEMEEVKAQAEAARKEASEMRGEVGALKAELARMRAAAERQAAEVAYVKATAEHSEARINDVELALAAIKDGRRAEKMCEDREEDSAGKRRKREDAGKEEMADAPAGAGRVLAAAGDVPEAERDKAEREEGEAEEEENGAENEQPEDEVQALRARVEALEDTNNGGSKIWEVMLSWLLVWPCSPVRGLQELIATWVEVLPGKTRTDLSGASLLSDAALSRLTSLHSLTWLILRESIGFTAERVTLLYSLTGLTYLDLSATVISDASLEGIGSLKALTTLCLGKSNITDEGIKRLLGLPQLMYLDLYVCPSITSASMVDVCKLTALTSLRLDESGVTEDGLKHLTALTSLKLLTLPRGVSDSGMKYPRNMKLLETLGLLHANITAAGVRWLNGLKSLQVIGTEAEDVAGLIRDNFPGMVVTKDFL
ncbi:unnamed protein product [Closterium sp. Naga37s-1]|nr:unnamed protein product [Closterium sp. Naga37s-1]CAI5489064.1 unnamed protein product [Closterium sp. Naga37s-1]